MRTRKVKEPDRDKPSQKNTTKRSSGFFHGNKATCPRMKAVRAFYNVKDWVEANEPEFFDAFAKQTDIKSKRKILKKHK